MPSAGWWHVTHARPLLPIGSKNGCPFVSSVPDVFSTPALGALVEKTAAEWVGEHLAPEQMTVGAQIVINHMAATPEGLTVTATVTLAAIDGRRLDFTWTATDGVDEVGNGTHQRFVVDRTRFEQRLAAKKPQG